MLYTRPGEKREGQSRRTSNWTTIHSRVNVNGTCSDKLEPEWRDATLQAELIREEIKKFINPWVGTTIITIISKLYCSKILKINFIITALYSHCLTASTVPGIGAFQTHAPSIDLPAIVSTLWLQTDLQISALYHISFVGYAGFKFETFLYI